jgi:hypothetical protein
MAKAFSATHKSQLAAQGLTDAHVQQLASAGCDPDKAVAAMPQLKAQVEAAGFDFNKWLGLFMQILPIILQFFQVQPTPVVPPAQV